MGVKIALRNPCASLFKSRTHIHMLSEALYVSGCELGLIIASNKPCYVIIFVYLCLYIYSNIHH